MRKSSYHIDAKLILDYQSGDNLALEKLVKRWHKTFCNKAHWIVKDPDVAKDIAQETWNTIISKIDDLNDPKTFASWSLRIVCNKSFDWIKKQNKTKEQLKTYHLESNTEAIEENHETELLQRNLLNAIKKLPLHQQMVIRLFYVEDYSLKDISKSLNISEGTSKSRLYHAREKLKLILKNRHYEK
ncbi:sigma-70 family RNA polymerase sigma factor [Seonamhaeicola sediminis]|uniref:Sigma-70 family RNA polymerase sigma factor n=1 Tax=Seonamhaeicola sediminis TaxID=2528206 RepID=A0A562YBK5_9FLAO|nr:sigma-70 family RNA polymerase sigma factor [Seonamhaeicola sediminis]TWO31465.1 sigma-70 family RNA polymerase sigma factor [Seonamhaeicola sediminis]